MWATLATVMVIAASPGKPEEAARLKAAFEQGEALFAQGEYGAAIWNFRLVNAKRPSPELSYDLAKCHQKLGDFAMAVHYFREYLTRAPHASDGLQVAETLADLLSTQQSDGRGLLDVTAGSGGQVWLNGEHFPEPPAALFLAPGDYELVSRFPDGTGHRRTVSILTGKTTQVDLTWAPAPLVPVEAGSPARLSLKDDAVPRLAVAPPESSTSSTPVLRKAAYGVMGVALAALIGGSVAGALSSDDAGRLASAHGSMTYAQAQATADSANSKGIAANALWAGSAASAVAAGLMFAFSLPEPGLKGSGGGR